MSKPGGYIPTIWAYIEANSREYGFLIKFTHVLNVEICDI